MTETDKFNDMSTEYDGVTETQCQKTDADTGSRAINSNNEAVPVCMHRN
jgi:hypothetical protein